MLSRALRRFVRANIELSEHLTPAIVENSHAYTRYHREGAALLGLGPKRVIDVGAGIEFPFGSSLQSGTVLIGVDIDLDSMAQNKLLDQRIGCDACTDLRVPDGSIDLIMGRAVVEHLHDTAGLLHRAHQALADDGRIIVTFANKHAPFAILNRMLPQRISAWLLDHLVPSRDEHELGFPAYYDRASVGQFRKSLEQTGFEIEQQYVSYFSSQYYRFFTPLFLIGLAYDYLCYTLKRPRLASYVMFVAKKRSAVHTTPAENARTA